VIPGHRVTRTTSTPWRSLANGSGELNESGFTLIELIIVSLILPIIIGAITLALVSIFSLQGSVSGRLTGSGDAQVVSANYEKDVQSAALITTATSPSTAPSPCETSAEAGDTQVLGLQWGSGQTTSVQTEVSYLIVPSGSSTNTLVRNACALPSTTPNRSTVVSQNVHTPLTASVTCAATLTTALTSGTSPTSLSVSSLPDAVGVGDQITVSAGGAAGPSFVFSPSAAAATGAHSLTGTTPASLTSNFAVGSQVVDSSWGASTNNCGANAAWITTGNVTGVTLPITEPGASGTTGSNYSYSVTALPGASSPANGLTPLVTPNSSCGFATAGTGTYASSLCFVDFTPYSGTPVACPGATGYQVISAPIATTPYTLTFCLQVTGTAVAPHIIPTYFSPPTSEAFLGNNGFYTGIPGNPALYQTGAGTTTAKIIDIQVLDSNGNPATGWELVTGDAESTDAGEWMTWSTAPEGASAPVLNLLPNSSTSQIGNACADPTSPDGLTGIGTTTVECAASVSSDKTGTVMVEAAAPTAMTVTMLGTGLEAMFLGLLLP
jgi:prepilin-type N-terminal cleavage/methylation domain-containing protein